MSKAVCAAALTLGLIVGSASANAGGYAYSGYDWSGVYPPWAAEAFQPSN